MESNINEHNIEYFCEKFIDEAAINVNNNLENELKEWAISNNVTHTSLNELLRILNMRFPELPLHSRTLLKTNRKKVDTIRIGNGKYWHNGLKENVMLAAKLFDDHTILLSFNVDGLPLYHSSKKQFWPILASIENLPKLPPIVVGIYFGDEKPSDPWLYFEQFVAELNDLLVNGITIDGRHRSCDVRAFICDLPARAFVKGK